MKEWYYLRFVAIRFSVFLPLTSPPPLSQILVHRVQVISSLEAPHQYTKVLWKLSPKWNILIMLLQANKTVFEQVLGMKTQNMF